MRKILVIGFLFASFSTYAKGADSLWQMWNNKSLNDRDRMWALDELAWNLIFSEPDSARKLSFKVLDYATQIGNEKWRAISYNTIGVSYFNENNYTKSIEYHQRGLSIREQLKDSSGIAAVLGNIGNIYYDMKDHDMALKFQLKSLDIDKALNNIAGVASSYNNIGNIYKKLGNHEKALDFYKRSLVIKKEINDLQGIANSFNNIGDMYEIMGDYRTALTYYEESCEIEKKLNNKQGQLTSLISISGIFHRFNQLEKANKLLDEAYKIAQDMNHIIGVMQVYENKYKIYKSLNPKNKALNFYEKYIFLRDSLNSEDNKIEISRLQIAYDYEKRKMEDSIKTAQKEKIYDAEITAQNAQLDKQQTQLYAAIGGLFLIVVFSLFIVNRVRIISVQKKLIEDQKQLVETKNREITDSINYAKRIQDAILPSFRLLSGKFKDSFILYNPKDVVSGDFYWMEEFEDKVYLAAADCTGHGVPGAMISVVCSNALSKTLLEEGITDPSKILDRTRELVTERFAKSGEDVKDGMDISLAALKPVNIVRPRKDSEKQREENNSGDNKTPYHSPLSTFTLKWAGANNPLWIIADENRADLTGFKNLSDLKETNGKALYEIKPDKQSISRADDPLPFTPHEIELQKGDIIYLFTDGYQDQFGGKFGKKFKASQLKQLLLSVQDKPMNEQHKVLFKIFENWKGELEQIDDVCIIGLRV
ncbi:MAG: tetratricopeptide repeat protein [Flavobacteriales bacterium]